MAWCQKCAKWKPEEQFSFDRTGFRIGGKTGLRRRLCKKCKNADAKSYYARQRLGLTAKQKRNNKKLPQARIAAHESFMAENKKRMDHGLDPLIIMPGIGQERIAETVEEARQLTLEWSRKHTPWGILQAKIEVIKKRMATVAHLTSQTTLYQQQLDDLIKEQQACEPEDKTKKHT